MARLLLSTAVLLAALAPSVLAQGVSCSASQKCPKDTPCCSRKIVLVMAETTEED
jgi:hypothetical protein